MNHVLIYYYIYALSGLLPFGIYFIDHKHNLNLSTQRIRFLLLIFVSVRIMTDLMSIVLAEAIKNSFPAIHFSILLCYFVVLKILNEIEEIKFLWLFNLLGLLLFILDLTVTSTIIQSCLLSSLTTFAIIIGLSIKSLQKIEITEVQEKVIGSIFLFYLIAFAYYLNQELMSESKKIMFLGFIFFISVNIIFNLYLSKIQWLLKKN